MATEQCVDCGNLVSTAAKKCPHCGRPLKKLVTGPRFLIVTLAALVVLIFVSNQRYQKTQEESNVRFEETLKRARGAGAELSDRIFDDVARDQVAQYQISKRKGDAIQICVQAGMVVAAYLQAKDESEYRRWVDVRTSDCKRAGVPL